MEKRIEDYSKVLPILELYTAIQSEGSRAGYPTIIVRTTGCTHRCFFGEGGWCDSWYTSIHPEKGRYTFNDIVKIYEDNPHITEMMLTGGSPTMHPALVNELTYFCADKDIYLTMETEGSAFIPTYYPIDLISLSPKFSNSIPVLGTQTPQGKIVDQGMIDQHNKHRLNIPEIAKTIIYHSDYHIKPVFDKELSTEVEFEKFLEDLATELINSKEESSWWYLLTQEEAVKSLKEQVWCMPAGDTREALLESYPVVMEYCIKKGYKFTPRPHIIAYGTKREV